MKSDYVMVLGALQDEVPLVTRFQELGYKVIVVGKGLDYPCCEIADVVYDVDIRDKKAVLDIATRHRIQAIASNVVSIAGECVAWVAEQLELPGIGYDIAQRFTNKAKMRECASRGGVKVPAFQWVNRLEDAIRFARSHSFPLVIKPVDGNSSKGVYKIENEAELEQRFQESISFSPGNQGLIIEEFVQGKEYIVDAYTYDFECHNTDVAFKQHFNLPDRFISRSVVVQDAESCDSTIEKKLLEANKNTVEALGLPFGPSHGEYIYNEDEDEVYLVEVAARGGGVRLSSDLIPMATGIDVNASIAEQTLGLDPLKGAHFELTTGAAGWFSFALKPGRITSIAGFDEALSLPGVMEIDMTGLDVGAKARILENDSGKYGPILIRGISRDDCHSVFEQVKHRIKIEIDGQPDGILWD